MPEVAPATVEGALKIRAPMIIPAVRKIPSLTDSNSFGFTLFFLPSTETPLVVAVGDGDLARDALALELADEVVVPGAVVDHAGDDDLDLLAAQPAVAHQQVPALGRDVDVEHLDCCFTRKVQLRRAPESRPSAPRASAGTIQSSTRDTGRRPPASSSASPAARRAASRSMPPSCDTIRVPGLSARSFGSSLALNSGSR